MTTEPETLEQAMWHLFVHTAHDVCPDINEQDIEIVLRTRPDLFDMAAGTVMRTIRLQMLAAEHSRPHRNHAAEQREADERRCFAGDCAKDGVAGVDGAEPRELVLGATLSETAVMDFAYAATVAAPAGKPDTPIEARWPRPSLGKTEIP
jgi:hypothetical protein